VKILLVTEAEVCGPQSLQVTFNDGTKKRVNLAPLLVDARFEEVRDPSFFAKASVDSLCGTVVWPNGVDLPPEAIYELPGE
jgi:hypothetical protein